MGEGAEGTTGPAPAVAPLTVEAVLDEYANSVGRMFDLLRKNPAGLAITIPACPAWNGQQLLAHLVGTAAFLASGLQRTSDLQSWIDHEVEIRAQRSIEDLQEEWTRALPVLCANSSRRLAVSITVDSTTHEQDLRGALGPVAIDHEAGLQVGLAALVEHLGQLNVNNGGMGVLARTPSSQFVIGHHPTGLTVDFSDDWEMFRALSCRRTATQVSTVPQSGERALLTPFVRRYPPPAAPLPE
jgi:hypothetical protein